MKLGCTLILILLSIQLSAQELGDMSISIDSDRIIWHTSHSINTITGVRAISNDVFMSSPDSIVWIQAGGRVVERLHITSKHESWADINTDGAQTYDVVWRNIRGTIGFRRSNGETKIITVFIKGSVNAAPYEYNVSEIVKN